MDWCTERALPLAVAAEVQEAVVLWSSRRWRRGGRAWEGERLAASLLLRSCSQVRLALCSSACCTCLSFSIWMFGNSWTQFSSCMSMNLVSRRAKTSTSDDGVKKSNRSSLRELGYFFELIRRFDNSVEKRRATMKMARKTEKLLLGPFKSYSRSKRISDFTKE